LSPANATDDATGLFYSTSTKGASSRRCDYGTNILFKVGLIIWLNASRVAK